MDPILLEIVLWIGGFAAIGSAVGVLSAIGSAVGVLFVLAGWWIVTRVAAWFKG